MAAANVAMAGMNPLKFLRTDSMEERDLTLAIARAVLDQLEKRDRNLAVQIVNGVAGLFKR